MTTVANQPKFDSEDDRTFSFKYRNISKNRNNRNRHKSFYTHINQSHIKNCGESLELIKDEINNSKNLSFSTLNGNSDKYLSTYNSEHQNQKQCSPALSNRNLFKAPDLSTIQI